MKKNFFLISFFLFLILYLNKILSFQLRDTPFFCNRKSFISCIQKSSKEKTVINLKKSISNKIFLTSSNVNKDDVYKDIENNVRNINFLNKSKSDNTNNLNKIILNNFLSDPNDWNKIVIDNMNNKDIISLVKFLYMEYKKSFLCIDEERKKADITFNSEKIKSLFAALESVTIEDMNVIEFHHHLDIYLILLKCCKDNYTPFSFVKNEIVSITDKIVKYSQSHLHDEHVCNKIKNEFVNMLNLIKEVKKNEAIETNVKNFLQILNSNIVLNNNNIFYFMIEIFSSINLLVKNNSDLIYKYDYVINPRFFFLCIFSLYSYNLSKARFYYFMLLIHNQVDILTLKKNVKKYDDDLNYSKYKNFIINTIFEKEKIEYESIEEIIVDKGENTSIKKVGESVSNDLNKELSYAKEMDNSANNIESLIEGGKNLLFKELYGNILIKILLFYIFFYFSDYYFCIIILLNFQNFVKDKNQDEILMQTFNYFFFMLLDNLYQIRDYSKIILLLGLFRTNFNIFDNKSIINIKKILNSIINESIHEQNSNVSKLLLDINNSIKNIENKRKSMNKNNASNLYRNKNIDNYLNRDNITSKEENKKEIKEIKNEHTKGIEISSISNAKNENINLNDSYNMSERFNKILSFLLKNKKYDKIESMEKRDNLYANNKTYSLFIQSFLNNHKYDKVYKVYKKMKSKKNIPITYLNVKHLIHSFKKCDIDKGDVLNELQLISKAYLNLYFSKDSYFVLTKTLLYKHLCDYLKKKCEMKLIIDIFNFNELLKYFIKFKSFINIKKLYFLLLKYSYIKTYKTYLILIRFFNNLNYESSKKSYEDEIEPMKKLSEKNDENMKMITANEIKCSFEKNEEIYNDIKNLRKNKLFYYICKNQDSQELDLFYKIYEIAKKDKYEISLFILSNFITEYILFDYSSDDIIESELSNIGNILNIFFESISLFFYKQDYKVTLNIFFFLLLFLNCYVTKYIKNDSKNSIFLKKNAVNFFLSHNYEIIKISKDDIYAYIPQFILNIISLSIKHLKNIKSFKGIDLLNSSFGSYNFSKNIDTVNYKNIMYIFLLLKNNLILNIEDMEKDIYDRKNKRKNVAENISEIKRNFLYKDVIEKNYKQTNKMGENSISDKYNNIADVFVKLKYTVGSNKINEDSLKEFLFNKLNVLVNNKDTDLLIDILKDIFFTYKNILYLSVRDFLNIYEKLNGIYDNILSVLTIIFFNENKNFKEHDAGSNNAYEKLGGSNEISILEFINNLKTMNKTYFKDILSQNTLHSILKRYESFVYMCIYFDLNKKKVNNIINFLEFSRMCNVTLSTEILIDVFSLFFERKMNNLIFKEFDIFSSSKKTSNFELYYIVMKAGFFEENVRIILKVFNIVLNLFNLKNIPLNFFECILFVLKKKGKFKDLYDCIDKVHRELINYEKNKPFYNLENLTSDLKSILDRYKKEKQF
ncbi:conserved Plasmodium protein, unknown function [Plasmodium gallinaceum]|uniref:Uncharacterized protein n=1 Tax=Plasmodium gallinaceum TaxID=5849 RepID=A0A1J1GLG7_PLAGA|nr:conserved Plasmodium protein, unknown function [Plasmodium gallinaceum]CRG93171.1 conserved Plasmodium protein, unknown function [Plasmodium gallinaceum]